ncbi:MAG TPA: lipopolysaccharide transport periplasmic protein LptA [Gammaproteobacteria bacterium]|nr:lipopolysaccharide transport periplasmic protein LptA [Gammaproteobacteria bacterium]
MFHKRLLPSLLLALISGLPMLVIAQLEDENTEQNLSATNAKLPIKILADEVEVDPNNNISVYSGNVELRQGEMSLTADSLTASVKNGQLNRLEARGKPARFSAVLSDGRPVLGEATSIDFKAAKEILVLKGEGLLKQGGNSINNDRIEFNLKTGHFNAGGKESNGRVEVILQPASE